MSDIENEPLLQGEATCGSFLYELQVIWDEVGETEADREKMLFEIKQECLEVYRRKVEQANFSRTQLRQTIADTEAELAAICFAMGEPLLHMRRSDRHARSLREELERILLLLEEMRKRKSDRRNQFVEVLDQTQRISNEINGPEEHVLSSLFVDETDLSLRKLEELHRRLYRLQAEKSDRLKGIQNHLNTLKSLCSVLGMDFKQTASQIHPSLAESEGSRSIRNDKFEQLETVINELQKTKIRRMQTLQDLATTMLELWNLMDTPLEEQQKFRKVTCNIAATDSEIIKPNSLSVKLLEQVEAEVSRLDELKSSKMKELVLRKSSELEELCRKTHMVVESGSAMDHAVKAIESGHVEPETLLEKIELEIAKMKEEALSRKEILDKVEKWLAAYEEENWLEEYNKDENRYSAGRGTHLILKRAEKARILVTKLPGMVEALSSKIAAWEKDNEMEFLYDGTNLLSMLEDYTLLRQEKEQQRRRQRDQKKLQGQLMAEQEVLYGSRGSPSKSQATRKGLKVSTSRRLASGGTMPQTPRPSSPQSTKSTPQSRPGKRTDQLLFSDLVNAALSTGQEDGDLLS